MNTPDAPHVNISELTKVRLPLVMLLTLLGVVAAAAALWREDRGMLFQHSKTLSVQESRIRVLEEAQIKIGILENNVEWIRAHLERRERTGTDQ